MSFGDLTARLSGSDLSNSNSSAEPARSNQTVDVELRGLGGTMWHINWLRVLAGIAGMSQAQLLRAGARRMLLSCWRRRGGAAIADSKLTATSSRVEKSAAEQLEAQVLQLVELKLDCSVLLGMLVGLICNIAAIPRVMAAMFGVLSFMFNLLGARPGLAAIFLRPNWCLILLWTVVTKAAKSPEEVEGAGRAGVTHWMLSCASCTGADYTAGGAWPLADWQMVMLIVAPVLIQAYICNVIEPFFYRQFFLVPRGGDDAGDVCDDGAPVAEISVAVAQSIETVDALGAEIANQLACSWSSSSSQNVTNDLEFAYAEAGEAMPHESKGNDSWILVVGTGKGAGKVLEQGGVLADYGLSSDCTLVVVVCELSDGR